MIINQLRLKAAEFLGTPLIESKYFFADYWTFIHLTVGFSIMFLVFKYFKKMNTKRKFAFLFVLIGIWEIYELESSWIAPEKAIDIIYDFIAGMFGGGLGYLYQNNHFFK